MDEILKMVNIALGNLDIGACLPGDATGEGVITVDEILTAVNNALNGCTAPTLTPTRTPEGTGVPATATRTATPTATTSPSTPAPTTGPGTVPRRAAATTVTLVQGLQAIPAVISSLAPLASGGAAGAFEGAAAADHNCNGGGTYDFTCTQAVPGTAPRNYTIVLNNCTLNTTASATVTLNGTITAQSTAIGTCGGFPPPFEFSSFAVNNLHVTAINGGVTTLNATVNLTGSLSVTVEFSACIIAAADMRLTGTVAVQTSALNETLGFDNTEVRIDIDQFSSPDCVPLIYSITLNGPATLTDVVGGTFSATFTGFVFHDDRTSGNDVGTVNGTANSACLGSDDVTFQTVTPLSIPPGSVCPTLGAIRVTAGGNTDRITYTSGGVTIDVGDNGSNDESYDSCLDSRLFACPAG